LQVLESVPDPRKKRGVRHRFSVILFISVCAVVSGARSFAAIVEWAADSAEDVLAGMGIGAPDASTIRRALSAFTGDGFDTAIGAPAASRLAAARAVPGVSAVAPGNRGRRQSVARLEDHNQPRPDGDGGLGPRHRSSSARSRSVTRRMKSLCSQHFSTRSMS
jgi:hypothetical protein